MDLSVILPTYNEKNNIVNLVNQILEVIKNIENKEIIIVDDNSPDGTYLTYKTIKVQGTGQQNAPF